jgi:hypothetical protein
MAKKKTPPEVWARHKANRDRLRELLLRRMSEDERRAAEGRSPPESER